MANAKKTKATEKPLPANKQKGKKVCSCCGETKNMTEFYLSYSPMYSIDQRVPICKQCCKTSCLKDDGSIDMEKFKDLLRNIDKPMYYDNLFSAELSIKRENSYLSDEETALHGMEILQKYFTLIAMRQDRAKSYSDAEKEGFMHQNNNRSQHEKDLIYAKYSQYIYTPQINSTPISTIISVTNADTDVKWSKKDKQNMKYVISIVGYDPFEDIGLDEYDRKYCFNIMSGYCDTDGITDDGHKMQSVIEMTMLYCQCRRITETMNLELLKSDVNDTKIQKLTSSKSSLLSSISKIAQDNNIASNFNKNSKQGQNSLTSKMKEMSENGFAEIEVNLFDIKTAEAFKQIDEISNTNIANQLTLDAAEYSDIIKEQREMILKYDSDFESLKEENRILKNKIIDLENKKR